MPRLLLVRQLFIYFRSSIPWQGTLLHASAILLVFLLACFRCTPLLLLRRRYDVSPLMESIRPHRSPKQTPILLHRHRYIERPTSDKSIPVITSRQPKPIMFSSANLSLEFLPYTLVHLSTMLVRNPLALPRKYITALICQHSANPFVT
jgi:hypothetical protein